MRTEDLELFKVYSEKSVITVRMAYKAFIDFINRNVTAIRGRLFKNYFVGGKENKGHFCIYLIHLHTEAGKIETTLRMPKPLNYNFSISYGAPFSLPTQKQKYIDLASDVVTSSSTHSDMLNGIRNVIMDLASIDMTVGRRRPSASVF